MFECQSNDPLIEMEKQWKPIIEMAPNCPRCASPNTKFCYYNNYSLSQPRYYCKGCRRYWTKGGSLRNIPVGGGCRKTRRSKLPKPRSPSTSTAALSNDLSEISNGDSSSDIDLAAVFANFLNPAPPAERDVPSLAPCREDKIEVTIPRNEISELGFQNLLQDDEDEIWREESPSFSWPAMAYPQDMEAFIPSPQMNLANDNIWGSFDFSGFEIFSGS